MTHVPQSDDVLTQLASKLSEVRGDAGDLVPIGLAERARLLRIARDVAHATERQNAPLAAYMIGRFVQESVRTGVSESDAIDTAAAAVRSLIGDLPG